jgi:hypothetical protein
VKRLARFRDELPLIVLWRKGQPQDAVGVVVADLAVFERRAQERMAPATGAYNDFANATAGIANAIGVLRSESLIRMLVGGKDQIGVRGVKVLPKRMKLRMTGMVWEEAATEKGVVPVGQKAGSRMGGQILT